MTGSPSDPSRSPSAAGRGDGDLGGIAASADGGLADALQRSSERGDDDATGLASTGQGTGGEAPRDDLGGKNEPGSAPGAGGPGSAEAAQARGAAPGASVPGGSSAGTSAASGASGGGAGRAGGASPSDPPSGAKASDFDHSGKPPGDEGPLESWGRAVSEVVTAPAEDETPPSTTTPTARR